MLKEQALRKIFESPLINLNIYKDIAYDPNKVYTNYSSEEEGFTDPSQINDINVNEKTKKPDKRTRDEDNTDRVGTFIAKKKKKHDPESTSYLPNVMWNGFNLTRTFKTLPYEEPISLGQLPFNPFAVYENTVDTKKFIDNMTQLYSEFPTKVGEVILRLNRERSKIFRSLPSDEKIIFAIEDRKVVVLKLNDAILEVARLDNQYGKSVFSNIKKTEPEEYPFPEIPLDYSTLHHLELWHAFKKKYVEQNEYVNSVLIDRLYDKMDKWRTDVINSYEKNKSKYNAIVVPGLEIDVELKVGHAIQGYDKNISKEQLEIQQEGFDFISRKCKDFRLKSIKNGNMGSLEKSFEAFLEDGFYEISLLDMNKKDKKELETLGMKDMKHFFACYRVQDLLRDFKEWIEHIDQKAPMLITDDIIQASKTIYKNSENFCNFLERRGFILTSKGAQGNAQKVLGLIRKVNVQLYTPSAEVTEKLRLETWALHAQHVMTGNYI